jgi:dipeptidyl aminopeptidase/acylaminoacyl peptidase
MVTAKSPADVYSYNWETGTVTRWTFSEAGGLNAGAFPETQLVHFPSFDGRQIPAFLTRPPAKFKAPYPVIINIHGGPEGQARPGLNASFTLNELGIATVYPNVRGSSGYGKSYLKLDNAEKREDSVKDIGALLDWIAKQPDLDAKRVAVMGGSYGGYMTLASLVHYGDRLAGGIDTVGISNFVSFLTSTADYRRDLRRAEYGDERDPKMREHLLSISPLTNAAAIRKPLLIVQGLNDPRVPASESEQMKAMVRARGGEVWYLAARDEGHGFRRKTNSDAYRAVFVAFLRKLAGEAPAAIPSSAASATPASAWRRTRRSP